ncbi:MAG: ParB/RepB/Spo0J family partition protein [Desulfitobacteriaceae bacterium]|nr:ParB/RepB/Spo0J family partition protein [Desulfitobacteriaceae bacterium]
MAKRGLGRGLQALIPPSPIAETNEKSIVLIKLDKIEPNREQPRKNFHQDRIRELAESIKEHGVVQPIVVRSISEEKYEIVVGERRWRASRLAGLKEIPCVIRDVDQKESTELALIENIQREDLNILEEAEAYQKLISEHNYTQEQLAARLGKSRSYITNTLRLLNLAMPLQGFVRDGIISAGHARAILSVSDTSKQYSFAQKIIKEKLSVRQAEELAKEFNKKESFKEKTKYNSRLTVEYRDIQDRLRETFETKVKICPKEKGGRIEIEYYSEDDLTRIMSVIMPEES